MSENSVQEIRPADTAPPAEAPNANFKNYDQLISERPPLVRRIGGKTIEFPKYLPAQILLSVRKAEQERQKKGIKQDDEEAMWSWGFDLLKDILGPENFNHIVKYADLDIVLEITMDALAYYGLRSDDEQESPEGKAETGETVDQDSQSTPLSSTSTPSMPTSSDSTPESGTLSGDATHPTGSETGDSTSLESETYQKEVSS